MFRRIVRIFLRSVAVLAVLLVLAYLFRNALFGRLLADRIEAELAEAAGGTWSIHAVEGSWFGNLALVGLRLEKPPAHGPLVRFSCGRAEAHYDLWRLLGDDPLAGITTVRLLTADVGLDLTRPAAPPGPPGPAEPFELPALPQLEIDGRVTVRTESDEFGAGEVNIRGADVLAVTLADLAVPPLPDLTRVTARVQRLGPRRIGLALEPEGLGAVRVEASELGWTDDGWTVAAEVTGAGGRVSVRGDAARLVARIETPLDLAQAPWLPEPAAGTVAGEATVLDLADIRAELTVRALRYGEVELDFLEGTGEWRDGAATIARLDARAPGGRAEARGLRVETARPYYLAAAERLSVHVPDLRAFVPDLEYEASIDVEAASPDGRALTISQASVRTDGASFALQGAATLPVDPAAWKTTVVDLAFAGSVSDVRRFARDAPRLEGELTVSGRARGSLDAPVAHVELAGNDLVVDGRPVRVLTLVGDLDWPELREMSVHVDADAGTLRLNGSANLAERTLHDGEYEIAVPDLARVAKLVPDAPRLAGSLHGSGRVAWDGEAVAGAATLDGAGLSYDDVAIGAVKLRARVAWPRVDLEDLAGRGDWGEAGARGSVEWEQRTARIEALHCRRGAHEGWLAAPLAVAWGDGRVAATGLVAEVLGGTVTGDVAWTGRPEGALAFRDLDVARLDARLTGRAGGEVRADADGFALELHVPELVAEGHRGGVDVRARYAEADGVVVERLEVDAGELLELSGTARLPFRIHADGIARIEGIAPQADLTGSMRALAAGPHLGAQRATLTIKGDAEALALVAAVRDVASHGEVLFAGDTAVRLKIGRDAAALVVVAPRSDLGELEGAVRADRGFDWTDPEAYGPALDSARVSGRIDARVPDLRAFARLAPDLRHVEGRAEIHLDVEGPARAPDLTGRATLEGVSITPGGNLPPLQDARGTLAFDGRTLSVPSLRGTLGYEPIELKGSVGLPGDAPPWFDLAVKGENLLLVRDLYLRLRADVDVTIKGPLDALVAKGAVVIRDALYSRPTQLLAQGAPPADGRFQLFSFREGPLRTMEFDISVVGDRSFRVRNNVISGEFSLDVRLAGTGEVPEPQGHIAFRDTLVRMPFTSLKVDRGEVRFPIENPLAPEIEVTAHTRLKGYELDVQLTGEMPEAEVHVSARPSLSQEDAILLLTTGITRREAEQDGLSRQALTKLATFFGQQLVSSAVGPSDPDERTVFDRFSFEMGRDVSRSGKETMEGEFELSRRFFLRGERDRFDDYNMGIVWRYRFR